MIAVTLLFHQTSQGVVFQAAPANPVGHPPTEAERLHVEVAESAVMAALAVLARDHRFRRAPQKTEYLHVAQHVAEAELQKWYARQAEAPES
jgi:hypothetical protein